MVQHHQNFLIKKCTPLDTVVPMQIFYLVFLFTLLLVSMLVICEIAKTTFILTYLLAYRYSVMNLVNRILASIAGISSIGDVLLMMKDPSAMQYFFLTSVLVPTPWPSVCTLPSVCASYHFGVYVVLP